MAQTTYNSKKFDEMVEDLKGTIKGKEIEVQKTKAQDQMALQENSIKHLEKS